MYKVWVKKKWRHWDIFVFVTKGIQAINASIG